MKIELLYFVDCPSWKMGLENLKAALKAEKVDENIELIQVETDEKATTEKFLGSPSFRINGQDLWPEDRRAYHLGCRIYKTDNGMRGVPTIEMLKEKIRRFLT
ncbi:MAG: DUF2703 domain-containing protein [Anaerolineaceae bacterium]|nr:DUF2703 domain-containing protein [Anaerolineaceae bacterium]